MKPFITPKSSAVVKKLLHFQIEGNLNWSDLIGREVVAYAKPSDHSFTEAWEFQLIFDDGGVLEFSSACTAVVGWQEVGTLNIKCVRPERQGVACGSLPTVSLITPPFFCERISRLGFEDDDVLTECGIVINAPNGDEIIIATGVSPGSVSVSAPFARDEFKPEFPLAVCKREILK